MKFRYIGDSDNMTAYGYDFRDGNEPDVRDTNAINRLSGNRFFECVEPIAMPTMAGQAATGDMPAKKKRGPKPKLAQPTEA